MQNELINEVDNVFAEDSKLKKGHEKSIRNMDSCVETWRQLLSANFRDTGLDLLQSESEYFKNCKQDTEYYYDENMSKEEQDPFNSIPIFKAKIDSENDTSGQKKRLAVLIELLENSEQGLKSQADFEAYLLSCQTNQIEKLYAYYKTYGNLVSKKS